jgi:two-component system, OmpR family, alkaline phosphatase synthesis response regulator PhoP
LIKKYCMKKKLLIVDDEAHIRMLLEQTLEELEDEGVEFLSAENGEEALKIIQEENPQLVFLDVMMPKMNGMEVCRRIKKELSMEGVFIILLTAKGQELDRLKGQEVGADIYMTKPFDPEIILGKAREVLQLS